MQRCIYIWQYKTQKNSMLMKQIFSVLAMLAMAISLQAQTTFHDREINQVKGPVKSISVKSFPKRILITFSPEGKVSGERFTDPVYDANGYMQSVFAGKKGNTKVTYEWENGRLKSQTATKKDKSTKTTFVYDDKGNVTSEIIEHDGQEYIYEYYGFEFDSYGNWLVRKTEILGVETKYTRTIEYY